MSQDVIKIAEDWLVEISRQANGAWCLSFKDSAGHPRKAPDCDQIAVESIGRDFVVRVLLVREGTTPDTLSATGMTTTANYARVSLHLDGKWTRHYSYLKDTDTPTPPIGPKGGAMMDMGHNYFVELSPNADKPWELTFYEGLTNEVAAPNPSLILVEALKDDGKVVDLAVASGAKSSILVATGSTDRTTRARILWSHGNHYHRREFSLPV